MPHSPWLTFRQAREALRAGQPDEARRLLSPLVAEGYRKAIKLTRETARTYISRGEKFLRADDPEAAWRELLAAESLNTGEAGAVRLRQTLMRLGLAECHAALEAGNPAHVLESAARLRDRQVFSPELDVLSEAARDWLHAAESADRGEFASAKENVARLRERLDRLTAAGPSWFLTELDRRHERFSSAVCQLHEAVDGRHWEEAVSWADEAIAAAPNHREARALRAKAWEALQPEVAPATADVMPVRLAVASTDDCPSDVSPAPQARSPGRTPPTTAPYVPAPPDDTLPLPKKFFLWVDGVGGYLVCLGQRVTFGQATTDGPVDVPLFADVSRLHAELTRDAEGYVLESGRDLQVNGLSVRRATLASGDRMTLGPTCQFVFRKPVPISPTARLELVSGHRLPAAVDGVLLMAESLVMGPNGRAHVELPDVPGSVVLYRSKEGLGVRFDGPFAVDGRPCHGRAPLPLPAVVTASHFTFAVEPAGPRV